MRHGGFVIELIRHALITKRSMRYGRGPNIPQFLMEEILCSVLSALHKMFNNSRSLITLTIQWKLTILLLTRILKLNTTQKE